MRAWTRWRGALSSLLMASEIVKSGCRSFDGIGKLSKLGRYESNSLNCGEASAGDVADACLIPAEI